MTTRIVGVLEVSASAGLANLNTSLPHEVTTIPIHLIKGGDVRVGDSLEVDLDANDRIVDVHIKNGFPADPNALAT